MFGAFGIWDGEKRNAKITVAENKNYKWKPQQVHFAMFYRLLIRVDRQRKMPIA